MDKENTKLKIISRHILEWLIKSFYIFIRKFDQRGLVVALVLTSIPLALNLACVIIFFFFLIIPGVFFKTGFLGTGGLVFLNYLVINTYLEAEYIKRKRKLEGGYYIIMYLLAPIYFALSVFLFIYFFRFL